MTATSTTSTRRPKSTKAYKALIAQGVSEERALVLLAEVDAIQTPVQTEVVPDTREVEVVALVAQFGITREQAEGLVDKAAVAKGAAPAPAAPKVLTSAEKADALVARSGLAFTRGRVYGPTALAEAIVRVARSGEPEIVHLAREGKHRVATAVWKTEEGDVAIHNLRALGEADAPEV